MKENVGTLDSNLRLIVGIVLLELAAIGVLGPWACIGVYPLVTGMLRKCPLYRLVGYQTASVP